MHRPVPYYSFLSSAWGLSLLPHTGAQLMSVINNDENKTFGVTFRTPVANSKGTPHILEHSVLCGSDKYPIKVRGLLSPLRGEEAEQVYLLYSVLCGSHKYPIKVRTVKVRKVLA
mgnify:CR=1 FL=1